MISEVSQKEAVGFYRNKGLPHLSVPDAGGDALGLSILSTETLDHQVPRPRL